MSTDNPTVMNLTWVAGAPKGHNEDEVGKPYIVLLKKDKFEVIGNINLLGGECDCCGGGECASEILAHAFIELEGFTNVVE